MVIHDSVEQGTLEWQKLRCGKVTASELDNILKLDYSLRTGDGPHTYLCRKAAEIVRGQVEFGGGSWATEQGHVREESAVPWFELETDCEVQRVGFIEADGGMFGCSPDGLIGEDGGLEVKSPEPTAHVKYLLAGKVPNDYWLQVQGSLFATGRKWWTFVSYHRDLPKLVIRTERDEEAMQKIGESLATFTAKLNAAVAHLKSLQ